MSTTLSYDQLIATLQELVDEKRTVTLYIKTNSNRLGMFVLRNGSIDAMMYGAVRGTKALNQFIKVTGGSYRIADDGLNLPTADLPDTATIMERLVDGDVPQDESTTGAGAGAALTTPKGPALPYNGALSVVTDNLGEFLGPIAEMIITDTISAGSRPHGLSDWINLIQRLAREIPDRDEARQFLIRATQELEQL
jgi:hypothetical protein